MYEVQSDREVEAFIRGLTRRFVLALTALAGIVALSTIGLFLLGRGGEGGFGRRLTLAFWDTLNLISTVGSLDEEFTPGQRAWAMGVIIFGLGAVLFAYGTLQGLLSGGDVLQHFARKRMQRTLEHMTDHIVVCGYGHVGQVVARRVRMAGRDLVVIDQDEQAAASADADGYFAIHADVTDERTLREAGVERASGLLATLDSDASNVYLVLLARELNPDIRIVARGDRASSRRTLRRAGAHRVIIPGEIAGTQLSHYVLKPHMSDFIAAAIGEGDFDFDELQVAEHAVLVGKSLRELNLPARARIIVISIISENGESEFNPPADRVLDRGDTLLVVTHKDAAARLAELG